MDDFILYINLYCSKHADNGLPWIKLVQNFTIPMLTDLRQRAKWTQTRKEKKKGEDIRVSV